MAACRAAADVVVTAVEQGNGKRAGMLSDYTFAVRDGERLLNIGKAYSGLTDDEIRRLGALWRHITVARYGPVRAVAPEVVLEVAFDTIQKSSRHKSGFALRFPRIVRIRETSARRRRTPRESRGDLEDDSGNRVIGGRHARPKKRRARLKWPGPRKEGIAC